MRDYRYSLTIFDEDYNIIFEEGVINKGHIFYTTIYDDGRRSIFWSDGLCSIRATRDRSLISP